MPSKRWIPELSNLCFVDTTDDECNAADLEVDEVAAVKPKRRTTRSASLKATAMEKEKPPASQTTRQFKKRKVK